MTKRRHEQDSLHAPDFLYGDRARTSPSPKRRKDRAPARRAGVMASLSRASPRVPQGPLLEMVYEDKHYCFVNKPAGHGLAPKGKLLKQVHATSISNGWELNKLLFRLSPGASGIVVFAKTKYGIVARKRKRIVTLKRTRKLSAEDRTYLRTEFLMLVRGKPSEEMGIVKASVMKQEGHYILDEVRTGADVIAQYRVVSCAPHQTLGHVSAISVVLAKGHTDYLRAVAQQILGTPILGDTEYGGPTMAWTEPYVRADDEEDGIWGKVPDTPPPAFLPPLFISDGATKRISSGQGLDTVSDFALAQSQTNSDALDIMQRFKASKFDEDDNLYYAEFPADEVASFPEEVKHQQLLKVQDRERAERRRVLYDTDDEEEEDHSDASPYCLHRYRMYYNPKPARGYRYDLSIRPTWGSFLAVPDQVSDPTKTDSILGDVTALKQVIRMSLDYCDQDSDVDSDEDTDDEY